MSQPDEDVLTFEDRLDARLDPAVRDQEAPTADAAEQAIPANPLEGPTTTTSVAFEANEYDVLEQDKIVDLDDEY